MADNKKYYYMRLNENYFDSDTQVLLESMPDGYLYSNILLKLYLKSLKNDGRLMFNDKIPYSPQMVATITRHQVGTVEKALKIFKELNIIDIIDTGAIYMLDIQNFIGKSNTEADRKRAYRKRIEDEKKPMGHLSSNCPLEIEIESEIKTEIKTEIEIEKKIDINENELLTKEFENLWKLYPRQVGKEIALEKYKSYRKSKDNYCTYEEVLNGLEKYLKYIKQNSWYSPKNGSTWFSDKGWLDNYRTIGKSEDTPFWFDEIIEKKPATRQEQEEMEKLLAEIG